MRSKLRFARALCLSLLALAPMPAALAAAVNGDLFGAMKWRLVGPFRVAVPTVAGQSQDPGQPRGWAEAGRETSWRWRKLRFRSCC